MIRITVTQAAFEATDATLPLGSMGYENKIDDHGNRLIWLPRGVLDRLNHLRGPTDTYSDVIMRTAGKGRGVPESVENVAFWTCFSIPA